MEKTESSVPLVKTRGTHKEKAIEHINNHYANHLNSFEEEDIDFFKKYEKEKSEEQLAILDFVSKEAMNLMAKHGREPYKIPHENFHLIQTKAYREKLGLSSSASADSEMQGVVFKHGENKNNLLWFGHTAFHEILHLLAPLKLETSENGFKRYQQGVSILTLKKDIEKYGFHEHFKGLHETIVSRSTGNFFKKLLEHPLLKKQKEWQQSQKFKSLKKEKSLKYGKEEDEILWVSKNEKHFFNIAYPIHQKFLQYICEEIQKEFSHKYQNTDEVFEEFERAHFTGKLFEIARLTEKTFGKSSFRSLGDMDEKNESASRKFEEFRKLRRIKHY